MYIKCDYCKTSIERLLSEHENESFQIIWHSLFDLHTIFTDLLYNISVYGFKKKKINFDFWCFNNISAISYGDQF